MNRSVADRAGRRLPLSNLEKDLYPSYGFTKAQVLAYYRGIAPFILPHLKDRALTLKRFPDGVAEEFFYEKRCPSHRPAWVRTADLPQEHGEPMTVCLVNDLETLLWAGNLASLELHVPLARAGSPGTPDVLIFDLDPGEGASLLECGRAALILRDLLSGMGLASRVKTSGSKGLHVAVPLNRPDATFDDTRTFSRAVAGVMQRHYPELVTARMAKTERQGKVFINWSQNDASKTMISVYSLRGRERPFASAPLAWSEVEVALQRSDPALLRFLASDVLERAAKNGDLYREVLTKAQRLPHL